jgi:cold shock CspA family protein
MSATNSVTSDVQRILGQVKWFNNKAGYGFITVSDGEQAGKDIFIHFSSINASESQYKYLVQGEYVEFVLDKSASETHEFQATQVSGIKGGKLMCETRRLAYVNADGSERPSYRRYRVQRDEQQSAPVTTSETLANDGEFTKVEKKTRGRPAGLPRTSAPRTTGLPRSTAPRTKNPVVEKA